MRSIEALGAAGGEVTGSSFAATTNKGTTFLVDAGMHQGTEGDKRNKTLNGHDLKKIAAVLLTHAHLDHAGLLPQIVEAEQLQIYMTPPTLALTSIALRNAENLSPHLYPKGSVDKVLKRTIAVPYNVPISVDGFTATFRDAGHILGSASLEIREQSGERTVFSGDLGNTPSRTVKPTTPIEQADVVVMESTYGDRRHPQEDPIEVILEAVERIKRSKGTLLIPTFAIDRTQIILNILKQLRKEKKLDNIPVFLDTPMGIAVTEVYKNHHELLNDELRQQDDPFNFPGLVKTHTSEASRAIHRHKGPKIIIAGSGMMNGGRIVRHAVDYLTDMKSVLLIVGFPAEGTPSRAIADGEKAVLMNNEYVHVGGKVLQTSGLSAHADQEQLLRWLGNIWAGNRRLRQIILVHGSNPAREALAHEIKTNFGIENVSLPSQNEKIDLQ